MKPINHFQFQIVISAFLAGSFLLMTGCPPIEGPVISTDKPVKVKCPIAISFIEAVMPYTRTIKNVEITINDPNGKVVTVAGYKFQKIRSEAGIFNLALDDNTRLDKQSPYSFSIHVKAPGFFETVKTIIVRDEQPSYVPIYMVGTEGPPQGITVGIQPISGGQISGGVLTSDFIFTSISGGNPGIEVFLPAGTQLKAKEQRGGKEVNFEKVSLSVAHGDPMSDGANYAFPGGSLVTNAVDRSGKQIASPTNSFYFNSGGWATFEMTADGVPLEVVSEKIMVSMPINPKLLNPTTKKPYQVGETAPLWSLNNNSGQWKEEYIATVVKKNNGLCFEFPVTHFSTWNVDYKGTTCPGLVTIRYNNTSGCPGPHYCELRSETLIPKVLEPTFVGETDSHVLPFNIGAGEFTINNAPNDKSDLLFRIYESANSASGASVDIPIGESCNTVQTEVNLPVPGCENYAMEFFNSSGGHLCNFAVWYKEINMATYDVTAESLTNHSWSYAGSVGNDGILRTGSLPQAVAPNNGYRILMWWGFNDGIAYPEPPGSSNTMRFTLSNSYVGFTGNGTCPALAAPVLDVRPATFTMTLQPKCYTNADMIINQNCSFSPLPVGNIDCNDAGINTTDIRRVVVVNIAPPAGTMLQTCL